MATRKISQLDQVDTEDFLSSNPDFSYLKDGGNVLKNFYFETSELHNEQTQQYLSKKMSGLDLSAFLLTDVLYAINQLSSKIDYLITSQNS